MDEELSIYKIRHSFSENVFKHKLERLCRCEKVKNLKPPDLA